MDNSLGDCVATEHDNKGKLYDERVSLLWPWRWDHVMLLLLLLLLWLLLLVVVPLLMPVP